MGRDWKIVNAQSAIWYLLTYGLVISMGIALGALFSQLVFDPYALSPNAAPGA
ncbi:MAG: hypothetical protein KGH64_04030 [Candidatus Micrarchaeota archaeon]|nr:hypothetical protein [Candidatus Micrarchaeota archaeon]MDE1859556.1 hypothetical protein [Candidatus Micrarchaeota archaeon]